MKIYMVNQGALEEIPEPIFSTGDAYIVEDPAKKMIYIWLGKSCSVDEKATASREAVNIDQADGGNKKIVTFDQDAESKEFLALLHGLKIVDKNLAKSMLKDVQTGSFAGHMDHIDVLFKISSEEFDGDIDAIKFVQVPFKKESLDHDDCMLMDLGNHIWVWQGKDANTKEKVKAMKFAREFDAKRAGAQDVKIFIDGEDDEEFLAVFDGKKPEGKKFADFDAEKGSMKEAPKEEPKPAPKAEAKPAPKEEPKPAPKAEAKPAPKAEPQAAGKGAILIQEESGRLKCPTCGNVNRNMMREVENRDHIIMDYPLMYGKKYICGNCGQNWRKNDDFE
jgi:predicted RNA-binding Zn-ribbon protein involved in translation (DUF1610 family)